MKPTAPSPINHVQRYAEVEKLLAGEVPAAAVAAKLIQLTASSNTTKDALGFEGQALVVTDLVRSADVGDHRKSAVLAQTNSILRASAKISAEHGEILMAAVVHKPSAAPPAPSPSAARAFLVEFGASGAKAGQRGAHDDWFVNLGPGSGKAFLETPAAAAIEARASALAAKKGVAVTDAHRLKAADELAKESKAAFDDGSGAAGRIFGLPYEKLEKVGGFARAKADANNAESVRAGALGLLAHLSGKDVRIDQTLAPSEYRAALERKFGQSSQLGAELESTGGPTWSELPIREREQTVEYFRSVLGELAELRMGLRSYEQLSPVALDAVSTTHDVYVHMRSDWLFDDGWGKAQAVPFAQLDLATKNADIPPFFFGLNGMVAEAEASLRRAQAN